MAVRKVAQELVEPGNRLMPAAYVFARNGDMVIEIDLPGVDPKDIHVKLEGGELTVMGERKADTEAKPLYALPEIKLALTEDGYYRKESRYGLLERHLSVPTGIKEAQIKAEYANGVLEISLPRQAKVPGAAKAKEIPVKQPVTPLKV